MKLAQFTSKRSSAQRLGVLIGERVVDVAALAASVAHSGEEGVEWLFGVTDSLDVIARGDEALVAIARLVEQALALGMVNRIVPDALLETETMALAQRLAKGPAVAYRYMKRNLNAAESGSLAEVFDLEAWGHTRSGMTEDWREATRAFVEKREPVFKGR